MKPSKHIESLLLEIHGEITGLNVEEDFRGILLEDIELACECFKEKNILCVINCLAVLADKLQTYLIFSRCYHQDIKKLLIEIHHLQQILIKLPVCIKGTTGTTGATGPCGPAGTPGPMGPMGPTGATGLPGTATIIMNSTPVSCYPITQKTPVKFGCFDSSIHMQTFCKSCRRKSEQSRGWGCPKSKPKI